MKIQKYSTNETNVKTQMYQSLFLFIRCTPSKIQNSTSSKIQLYLSELREQQYIYSVASSAGEFCLAAEKTVWAIAYYSYTKFHSWFQSA